MKKQSNLTLVDLELTELHRQFDDLLAKTNKNNPKDADIKAFKKLLADHPKAELWNRIGGIMGMAENFALAAACPLPEAVREVLGHKQSDIRKRLGYDEASEMEKLLITYAALCWLRLGLVELYHTNNLAKEHTLTLAIHYDKRLMMAQRRFTRACETLARVRRLGVMTSRQDQPARSALTA